MTAKDETYEYVKHMTSSDEAYGGALHAAMDALSELVDAQILRNVAKEVIIGLRARGFIVSKEPRCECGWLIGNHQHDIRMGRANKPKEEENA